MEKSKKIFYFVVSFLIVFVILTATLIGVVYIKQRDNDYHEKYIELLTAIQFYDYYTTNTISTLITDLKSSKYYSQGSSFVKSVGNTTSSVSVLPSVRDISYYYEQILDLQYKTEWALDKKERFSSLIELYRIDGGSCGFKFTNEFYNGNEFARGINLFTSLGNIEWADNQGNKLIFVMEEPEPLESGGVHRTPSDKLVIDFNGGHIESWADNTEINIANLERGDSIFVQCNKDSTSSNFKILSIEYNSNGNNLWHMTIQEIVSQNAVNEYVLTATIE